MGKWLKIMFVASVVLNVALIAGAVWARGFVRDKSFELAAINAEAEGRLARHVLTELESGEPDRVEAIKELLQNSIRNTEKAADMWRSAAKN